MESHGVIWRHSPNASYVIPEAKSDSGVIPEKEDPMSRFRFTEPLVRNITAERQKEICEDGLCLRVYPSGRKAWFLAYRNSSGRFRRVKLGNYPAVNLRAARRLARLRLAEVAEGRDPQEEKVAARAPAEESQTFAALAALYLSEHARPKKKSWSQDQRYIERDLLPAWKDRLANEITRQDVVNLVQAIVQRGAPVGANRALALIGRIFSHGVERQIVEVNPRRGLSFPAKERPRSRVLDEAEIQVFWRQLELLRPVSASALRFLLLTGQRCTPVYKMRHEQVAGDIWNIPASVMKSGREHRVFLSAQALQILSINRSLFPKSPWVFPSPKDRNSHLSRAAPSALNQLRELCGFHFTRHDLRRTCATHLSRLGCPRHLLMKILDHEPGEGGGVTWIYDRYSYDDELREWMGRWGQEVERLGTLPPE
jgi:integrase